jgi:diaminopimelate decarboxylase
MVQKLQRLQKPLENRKGTLFFDSVSALELAEAFDTPLYVVSENQIRENYRRLRNALKSYYEKIRVYYAAKANSNLSVLKILETEGAFLDAVSPGEVFMALTTGFPEDHILFTGTSIRTRQAAEKQGTRSAVCQG